MALTTYDVECVRSGDWWAVEVPKVPGVHTQARRLDQVPAMVKDAIALMLDVPEDDVAIAIKSVRLTPEKDPAPLERELDSVVQFRRQVEVLQGEASVQTRALVEKLVSSCGLSFRDAGRLLGVSHQRVAQLLRESDNS